MITSAVFMVVGLLLLLAGAELLVRGGSRLAGSLGVSPLVIGLTVVAFGTSAPEMAVSISAAIDGSSDVALGNVVGSNIFNVLFILGLTAAIAPLPVARQLLRADLPIMVIASIVALGMAWDGSFSRIEGGVLFAGLVAYVLLQLRFSAATNPAAAEAVDVTQVFTGDVTADQRKPGRMLLDGVMILAGLGLLVAGSKLFVGGAVDIATALGVSELVIGLTIVAAGTSLPEVATSVVAAVRNERDIAVGNVVGSNIFNLLGVLGGASLVSPINVAPQVLRLDLPVMLGVALLCIPILYTGSIIRRWEGLLLLAVYVGYTVYLIMQATAG